ncbi:hypothetical protein BDW59DRAFT_150945 [Aspergillus cavernicola]|uniref:Myb-like domain-containing protein n=1 Tax=Aspergillus cavernicola TaxID=176166 RepID=A0ABR4HXZ8_9EURO
MSARQLEPVGSSGVRWTSEQKNELWKQRKRFSNLNWDEFHKLNLFPGRSLSAVRRTHYRMELKKGLKILSSKRGRPSYASRHTYLEKRTLAPDPVDDELDLRKRPRLRDNKTGHDHDSQGNCLDDGENEYHYSNDEDSESDYNFNYYDDEEINVDDGDIQTDGEPQDLLRHDHLGGSREQPQDGLALPAVAETQYPTASAGTPATLSTNARKTTFPVPAQAIASFPEQIPNSAPEPFKTVQAPPPVQGRTGNLLPTRNHNNSARSSVTQSDCISPSIAFQAGDTQPIQSAAVRDNSISTLANNAVPASVNLVPEVLKPTTPATRPLPPDHLSPSKLEVSLGSIMAELLQNDRESKAERDEMKREVAALKDTVQEHGKTISSLRDQLVLKDQQLKTVESSGMEKLAGVVKQLEEMKETITEGSKRNIELEVFYKKFVALFPNPGWA